MFILLASRGMLSLPPRLRSDLRASRASVLEEDKSKAYRKRAKSQTMRVQSARHINVNDPKEGKTVRATINSVAENDADPNYVRRNIITKGAVVDTDVGRVRVTSRPGMHGVVSGVLLED